MYPAILRDELFPTRIGPKFGSVRPDELLTLCRSHGIIARVTIRADRGEFPLRTERGTMYPTGIFTTTLAGPDLLALSEWGAILKVHYGATYRLGKPFCGSMDRLLASRASAEERGDTDSSALSKLVSNSLGGRLAMRPGGWRRCAARDGLRKWGEYHIIDADSDTMIRYRYLCGRCDVWEPDRERVGPYTFAFAYLTAYGRQRMARLRALCPPRSVVAQSTDGLYLLPAGIRALTDAGALSGAGPGTLRITGTAGSGQWWTARHYRFGDKWTLAGWAAPYVDVEKLTVTYTTRSPLSRKRERDIPDAVNTITREVFMPVDCEQQDLRSDGWLYPRHFNRSPKWCEE